MSTEGSSFSADVRDVGSVRVVSIREKLPGGYPDQGRLWNELNAFVKQHEVSSCGPSFTINYSKTEVDVEVCIPIGENVTLPNDSPVAQRLVPGGKMAVGVHKGPLRQIGAAYPKLFTWIDQQRASRGDGPTRESYINMGDGFESGNDRGTVVEIMAPLQE